MKTFVGFIGMVMVCLFSCGCTVTYESPYALPIHNGIANSYLIPQEAGFPFRNREGKVLAIPAGATVVVRPSWNAGDGNAQFEASVYDASSHEYLGIATTRRYFPRYYDPYSGYFARSGDLMGELWIVDHFDPLRSQRDANTRPPPLPSVPSQLRPSR